MTAGARIFVVEDQAVVAMHLQLLLRDMGFQVCGHCVRGRDALAMIPNANPDLLLLDIHLADDVTGLQVAEGLRGTVDVPIVYLSAYTDAEVLARAASDSHVSYVTKPFDARTLLDAIEAALGGGA